MTYLSIVETFDVKKDYLSQLIIDFHPDESVLTTSSRQIRLYQDIWAVIYMRERGRKLPEKIRDYSH